MGLQIANDPHYPKIFLLHNPVKALKQFCWDDAALSPISD